jgi:hypothetical protein
MTDTAIDPTQFQEGMEVRSADGDPVGRVKEVQSVYVVVERQGQPDISVPFAFIRYTSGNRLVLTIPAFKLNEMHWQGTSR